MAAPAVLNPADTAVRRTAQPPDPQLLRRICAEYSEMPGLRLTRNQARRLWALDGDTCDSVLGHLVHIHFLVRGLDGQFRRASAGEPLQSGI